MDKSISRKWMDRRRFRKKKVCIVTKNAIHGGVETLIEIEAKGLNADVIVAGGYNNTTKTCPFDYRYACDYYTLIDWVKEYEYIIYHWPPSWAVKAIGDSGVPSIEFVHRTDTAECDKTVPKAVVAHSDYLCEYIREEYAIECEYVNNVVDCAKYTPNNVKSSTIGAVTSYYDYKGIDILIKGWKLIQDKFPEYTFIIFGNGTEKEKYLNLVKEIGARIILEGPVINSKVAYDGFDLTVSASRNEGLPLALLEAMSCNLPILASDIEGHKVINRLSNQYGYGNPIDLFASENPNDFAAKLTVMLNQLKSGFICNNRSIAQNVFSVDQHIKGLQNVIYKLSDIDIMHKRNTIILNRRKAELLNSSVTDGKGMVEFRVFPMTLTIDRFLRGDISLSSTIEWIDIFINYECSIVQSSWVQIDFMDEERNCIGSSGEGVTMIPKQTLGYIQLTVPNDSEIKYGVVSIRPDESGAVEINNIEINLVNKRRKF